MWIGNLIKKLLVQYDLTGFAIRNKFMGFDQGNAFMRRIGKRSIISILKKNGALIGKNCDIEVPLIFHNCRDFRNLQVGDNVHIGKNCFFDLRDKITIEDNVIISMQTTFITHIDMGKSVLAKQYPPLHNPIRIMHDSYIGANATLLMGVKVSECSLIAAGALVIGDVKPWTMVGGVPAKPINTKKQSII